MHAVVGVPLCFVRHSAEGVSRDESDQAVVAEVAMTAAQPQLVRRVELSVFVPLPLERDHPEVIVILALIHLERQKADLAAHIPYRRRSGGRRNIGQSLVQS